MRAVHDSIEPRSSKIKQSHREMRDLRRKRRVNDELSVVGSDAEKSKWNNLVGASVACKKWECWIQASVID